MPCRPSRHRRLQGFGLEFSELKEYTHGSFSNVASILFDCFSQYLPLLCLWHLLPAFLMMVVPWILTVDIDDFVKEIVNGFNGVSTDDESHDEPRVISV
ncbi:hypothetical protein Tsubulata_032151 [Turnera subulata]|uniref:Uncharacterized protein n=1 Tax=Turnera subulata TaxID=218843 RepID=A0A9Q0GBM2_9ROSI|nr:hypothetical protein Tsubulata_032151 [Turnera subulata]